jgi:hypothetical protein
VSGERGGGGKWVRVPILKHARCPFHSQSSAYSHKPHATLHCGLRYSSFTHTLCGARVPRGHLCTRPSEQEAFLDPPPTPDGRRRHTMAAPEVPAATKGDRDDARLTRLTKQNTVKEVREERSSRRPSSPSPSAPIPISLPFVCPPPAPPATAEALAGVAEALPEGVR